MGLILGLFFGFLAGGFLAYRYHGTLESIIDDLAD